MVVSGGCGAFVSGGIFGEFGVVLGAFGAVLGVFGAALGDVAALGVFDGELGVTVVAPG